MPRVYMLNLLFEMDVLQLRMMMTKKRKYLKKILRNFY